MEPHERAAAGLFLGFQYPVEIPGVSYLQFLRESLNSQRRSRGEAELSGAEFIKLAKAQAALLGMDSEMLKRPVNVGFSGGEKKRAEMVQMGIMDAALRGARRDRQRARHRRAEKRRRGHQPDHARTRQRRAADHPLPAPARLCAAGPSARAVAAARSSAAAAPNSRTSSSAKAMRRRPRDRVSGSSSPAWRSSSSPVRSGAARARR